MTLRGNKFLSVGSGLAPDLRSSETDRIQSRMHDPDHAKGIPGHAESVISPAPKRSGSVISSATRL
jgi:hypothetical protein